MSRKNKFLVGVSPLGLLALSACGGSTPTTYTPASGKAQSGPLQNATVFLDYNKDGVFQAGETTGITLADGSYSLTPTQSTYNVVVTTDASTTDSTINGVVSGLTLIAPKGADGAVTMVTPATTMVTNMMAADATLTSSAAMANVATALGFDSTKYNPLTFDAFADTSAMLAADKLVYDALALEVEKTSKKIMTVVNTFAAAVEGSGASEADAFTTAFGSVTSVLTAKIAASQVLDFDVAADITAVTTQLSADISKTANASKAVFDGMTTLEASIANVVSVIDSVNDITETANAFQTIGLLKAQVKAAATNEVANLSGGGVYKGQDADGISVISTVAAGAALGINGALSSGASVANSIAQKVTITSSGNDSGVSFTVVGTTGVDDIDGISGDASVGLDNPLSLTGDLALGGAVVLSQAQKVTITSSGDDSTVTFSIVGTDASGTAVSEDLVGASASAATSLGEYLTVTSITATGTVAGTVMAGFVPTALTEVLTGSNVGKAITEGSFLTIASITADGASAGTVTAGVLGTLTTVVTDPDAISVSATVGNNAALTIVGGGPITPAMASKVTIASTGNDSGISFLVTGTNAGLADADGISTSAEVGDGAFLSIRGALAANIPTGWGSGDVTNSIAHKVTISSTGDDSLVTFTVVGTDASGGVLNESVTGANAGTATSTNHFLTITSIKAVGDPALNVSAGISGEIVEAVTGANAGTATSVTLFETVTGIKAVGNPALNVSAGVLGNVASSAIGFSDASVLKSAADNQAPTDIFVTSKYLESETSLSVGNLGTLDGDHSSGHTYSLMTGLDAASFTLTSAGALSFVAQPDYETKSLYSIKVVTTDPLGKTFAEILEITVTNADEAPTITATGGTVTEDSTTNNTVSGTISAIDPEGLDVTYGASSLTGSHGGALVIDSATGAYTYTMNNNNGSVQDLQSGDTLTETFTVTSSDGSKVGSGTLSFIINGADDVYLSQPTAGALAQNAATPTVTGTLSGSDPASLALNYSIAGSISTAGEYVATGTYGSLTVNATTGVYVYTLDKSDADTLSIVEAAKVNETFTVSVDNGTNRSTKSLSIEITGVNDAPVVTAPTNGALTEGGTVKTVSSVIARTDPDTGESAGVTFDITGGLLASGNYTMVGTYGTLVLAAATGAYTYTLNDSDADTLALTAADNVTDTFTIKATDAKGAVGSGDLAIAIAGTGITINAIASDNIVNLAEADAVGGFNITGRGNVGETVTLTFSQSGAYSVSSWDGILAGGNTATVNALGDWSVAVSKADVVDMEPGAENVAATIVGDADGISAAATLAGPGNLVIGGALAAGGSSVTNAIAMNVTVASAGDDSGMTFKVTGTDAAGVAKIETITGANAGTAITTAQFLTITEIKAVGGTPAGSVSAGTATKTDPNAFAVDILAPATTIIGIQYVAETKVLKLTGTKFDEIGAAASDVKALVNWEKLVWDINGAGSGGVTFALADITSAIVTSGSILTITLTAEKAAALEATAGFGASGAADNVDVAVGFAVDAAGNISATDSIANALAGYSDVTAPTVTSFTSSTSDGSFKQGADINITANLSEVVLAGSSITVTLDTGNTVELTSAANANSLTGTYTVPSSKTSSDLSVASFVVTTGKTVTDLYGNDLAVVTIPSNVGDPNGISESATVSANANLLMSGTLVSGGKVVNAAAQKVVIKSVGNDSGITFKVTGIDASGAQLIETVTGASAGATATSVGFFKEVLEIKALGNTTDVVEAGTLTRGQNLNDNQALVIDTTVPTNTITEIKYDGTNNQIVFTGTDMDLVGAVGTDLKASMDWSKLVWDLDANASNDGVTFTASDITSAIVTSGTVLTVTLTTAKAAALESTVGFAHDGLTSTDTRDNIDVTKGFSVDLAGNPAETDGAANIVPTYSDTTAPTVTGFTSTNGSGSYKEGVQLNITANLDKAVVDGSSITVVLSTGSNETVVLTAAAIGTTMVGTYVVPSGVTSGDLAVSSFAVTSGKTVKSIYGPLLSNTTLPNGANLNDALDIIIDTSAPATTIASVAYSGADNQIVFTGTKFNNLAANNVEVKQHLDFSKLVWDLDGSASNAGVTFAASDFSSVKVTSATTLTAVLTTAKAAALEATVGFAADGLTATNAADQIDVATGFIRDAALNASTTDTAADLAVTYADTVKPTVSNFTSTTLDGGYKLDDEINITATMSEAVLGGSQLTVTLDSGGTALLTAAANGTTLTGTYTVGASNSSTDLNVSSYVITTAVSDLYGNTLSDTTLPASNLSNNKAITVDTTGPTNTISGVAYSSTAKTMTLAGAGFNTIDAVGTDVKSYLDWSKFVWDIDNSSSNAGITFSAGDITSAVITSATVMTITIKDAKAADMLSTVGFAADGLTATNTADNIDIAAGFSRDAAENASTTDAKADIVPTYSDTTAPTVLEFTSTTENGGYKAGDVINITATTSETVLAGSKIVVALNSGSGDTATLEASTNGNKMSGTYTVGAGDTSSDLSITQAFTVSSPVTDTYGNTLSVKAIPSGENLSDNSAIVIDTAIPTSTIASAKYDKVGGKITLTGANFTTVGASASDVKAQLDWTKFVWDLDGNASNAGVTFAVGDITSATITNATTMVIDLTAAKQLSLEATAGFGADGLLDTNTPDQIDIAAGFTRDAALNASTTDAAVNIVPTYADTARPTVSSFTSTTVDGSYNSGDAINITANMSEAVLGGSQMTVLLDSRSGNKVELTALQNGTTLVGTYTVAGADSSGDLKVSSYSLTDASGNLDSVLDVAGNAMSSVAIPGSQNLSDNSALVIDNVALFGNKTQNIGSSNPTQGETFALTFVESVKNTAALTAEVVGDAMFGATATPASTGWSNSDKTLTIALGAGETLNTNGQTFTFTSILDLADNESENVIYTFEIA